MLRINFLTWFKSGDTDGVDDSNYPQAPVPLPEPVPPARDVKALLWDAIGRSDVAAAEKLLDEVPALVNLSIDDKRLIDFKKFFETGPVGFDDRIDRSDYESDGCHYGFTPLAAACLKGDEAMADLFLARGADIETADSYGFTPIMCALMSQNENLVKSLINFGAELNRFSLSGAQYALSPVSPLTLAVKLCELETIELMLKKGADADFCAYEGGNPLNIAFEYNRLDAAVMLIKSGASIEKAFKYDGYYVRPDQAAFYLEAALRVFGPDSGNARFYEKVFFKSDDASLKYLIYCAARGDYSATMKMLIARGADIEEDITKADIVSFYPEKVEITPLIAAAAGGCYETARALVELGADISKSNNAALRYALEGLTVFREYYRMSICRIGSIHENKRRLLKLLIASGSRFVPGKYSYFEEPLGLLLAYTPDDSELMELVLNNIADDYFKSVIMDKNLIKSVAEAGHLEAVKTLLTQGASVDARDANGNTCLITAVRRKKNADLINLLIDNGADVNAQNPAGDSALTVAAAACGADIIDKLVAHGADMNHKGAVGRTALMNAIAYFNEAAALILIKKGCRTDITDNDGRNALAMAESKRMTVVAEAIKKAGRG
ncbi:MAG TPA: ankyrin repeat domain-containing protein [Candidatus Wallbacteria bacterium]|nr:ankyrin repeat domain-containing protein [Candidatus Wallbacteria bacterium]